MNPIEELLAAAAAGPECFKCWEPIIDPAEVRIVTVRVDGEPRSVWVHASHAAPA